MSVEISAMAAPDWPSVRQIYLDGIATGQATFELEAPGWDVWDRKHLPDCRLVARAGSEVVGWAALSLVSQRHVYRGVAEVSVYVAAGARGSGIGRTLLDRLIEASEQQGIWTLQASIFPENRASIELHRRAGFREVGVRERIGRMHGKWRDTVLFERRSTRIGVD